MSADQISSRAGSVRVGLAGYGLSGEVFHGPLIDSTPGMEIAGIVTGNPVRSAKAKARYPGSRVVATVDELWDEIDLLVVATPNRFHAELALAAISRDLPVVIDKPLAATLAEAEVVIEAGGRVTVFQNRRWDGDFLTVRALLDAGRLGEIFRFESRFERFRPEVGDGWRESGDPREGGGQLSDLGAHLVDQAILLFGSPTRVYAEVDRRRPGVKADDDVFLALEHENGVRSHLHMGKLAPLAGPRFRVTGLGGGLEIDGLDPQEAQLESGLLPGAPGFGERGPGRLHLGAGEAQPEVPLKPGAYGEFYSGVVTWVRGDAPPPVDPADSLLVMRVLEAARLSSERHEVIEFA